MQTVIAKVQVAPLNFANPQEKFSTIRNTLLVSKALQTCICNEVNAALDQIYNASPDNRTETKRIQIERILQRYAKNDIRPTPSADPLSQSENYIFGYIVPKIINTRCDFIDAGTNIPQWVMGNRTSTNQPDLSDGTAFFIEKKGDSTVLTNPGMPGQYEKAEVLTLEFTLREIPQQPLNRSSSVIPQYPQASTLQPQYPQHPTIQAHYQQPRHAPNLQPPVEQQRRPSNPQPYYPAVNYTQPVVPQPVVHQGQGQYQYTPPQGWPPQTLPYQPNYGQQYPNGYPPSGY